MRSWRLLFTLVVSAASVPAGEVLYINRTGDGAMSKGDRAIRERLEAMGHRVSVRDHFAPATEAKGKDLIFISETVFAVKLGDRFRDVAVPCVVSDCHVFPGMGMSGPEEDRDFGFAGKRQAIVLVARGHPIVRKIGEGEIAIYKSPVTLHWGQPSRGGVAVAAANSPAVCVLFTYEEGAAMFGIKAPARRVGLFIRDHHDDATQLTTAGWKLFDAAIDWALGRL